MSKRILFFLIISNALAGVSFAQVPNPAPDSIRSIVVKFRTTAAMSDATILSKIGAISASTMHTVFHHPPQNNSIQSVNVTDTFGLDRIVQIPLASGVTASQALQSLSGVNGIEYAEPNYFSHIQTLEHIPNDPLFPAQWWLDSIDAPQAWTISEGDSAVHIGFVDEGVNFLHPDLQFQFVVDPEEDINHNGVFDPWPSDSIGKDVFGHLVHGDIDGIDHNHDGYANDVIGYDFVDNSPIPYDAAGHGTAMAGIMAAKQDNGIGVSGVAPKCKLLVLKAFDETGTGSDGNIAAAIVYGADRGVKIINCSFGDIVPSLLQRDAIRYAVSKGVTIFASSGNNGGTGPNYPSDFDEVVSVGSADRADYINFTTHGTEMDVITPGIQLMTTTISGGYDSVSGTSASCAVASGIGALLVSKNPNLTPIQVRSILESTANPVGDRSTTANGELDADAALSYSGTAQIKMVMPHTLDEYHIGDMIHVTGYAMSTLFTGYSLSWSKDYVKDTLGYDEFGNYGHLQYDSIVGGVFDTSSSQVLDSVLGTLDTHGFDTGTYTISLAVGSSDNRSTQESCNVYMARTKPKFVVFSIDSIWVNTERGLLIQATTDIPAQLQVEYIAPGAVPSYASDELIGFEHGILIQREQAQAGVPLLIIARLVTPDGDTTTLDTTGIIPNEGIPQFPDGGFTEKHYTLPPGYALDSVLSVPTGDEVIENPYASGILTVYKFDSTHLQFIPVDSSQDRRDPQAIGNSEGTGGPELLVQDPYNPGTAIYKQNTSHSILGNVIFSDSLIYGSIFATLDTAGKQDVVGAIDSAIVAYHYADGNYALLGSDSDTGPATFYNSGKHITWENVQAGDFLGMGTEQLAVLDDAGNLMIDVRDRSQPNGFRSVLLAANDASAAGTLLAVGDFNGDGKPDIAYAYHPIEEQDTLDEYHVAYWTLVVLRNRGNLTFDTMYIDRFYGDNEDEHFFLNGPVGTVQRVTNVTGRAVDDLACSFFPNFYLLEYDPASGGMHPIWNYPVSEYGVIANDFDRNGKREFGFFTGDSIRFFEHNDNYTEQTPAPTSLIVTPRDTNRVDMEWAPVNGATQYLILRATLESNYFLVGSTSVPSYIDFSVVNGDTLIYSVIAISPTYSIDTSIPAYGVEVIVHPMPRLVNASQQSQNTIRVKTSQPPSPNTILAGTIMIDDTVEPNAITSTLDSELVLETAARLTPGAHRMRVTSFNLRDYWNSPFDTADYISFQVLADTAVNQFYIVRWTFEQGPNGIEIHVIFNQQPGADALDVSHYSLSPYGTLTSVSRDTANPAALYIAVNGVQLVALGVPFVLCVSGIESATNTPLDAANGNCAGISLTEPDLSNVMVYPNPAKQSIGQVTFARLTASADIRIYSIRMVPIRELSTVSSEGGVTWDLRDDNGKLVPSGEYFYYVTGTNDAGQAAEGTAAKLVIIDDAK